MKTSFLIFLISWLYTICCQANTSQIDSTVSRVFQSAVWFYREPIRLDSRLKEDFIAVLKLNATDRLKDSLRQDIMLLDYRPHDIKWLGRYLRDTECLSHYASNNPVLHDFFSDLADIRYNLLAIRLQEDIINGSMENHSFPAQYATQRLMENGYLLNLPPTNWQKLRIYVYDGRWGHILRSMATTHRPTVLRYAALLIGIVMILLIAYRYMKNIIRVTVKFRSHE